jgi:hypothetical protein
MELRFRANQTLIIQQLHCELFGLIRNSDASEAAERRPVDLEV